MTSSPLAAALVVGLLAGCAAAPLTPAQNDTAALSTTRIEGRAAAVEAACARVLPLAGAAIAIPAIGPSVALGVQVGCGGAQGIARLLQDPDSALWLAKQEEILKAAVSKRERS